jgi:hypothetical protein
MWTNATIAALRGKKGDRRSDRVKKVVSHGPPFRGCPERRNRMRFASAALAAAIIVAFASSAMGAIGWAGNIWPCDGAIYTSNDNIDVYVQVWKEGCTGPTGPCVDIEATLFYQCVDGGGYIPVPMSYNVAVGNNDEYTAQIPNTHGCSQVEFYVVVLDVTDDDTWYPEDQCGNSPNFVLDITEVTSQDVTVRFHLCLSGDTETSGDVCVTGAGDPLTNWGTGVVMSQSCPTVSPKLYEVDVLFPAGTNPSVDYKYRKDGCDTWESTGNHNFVIDDSSDFMDLWIDGWEFTTPDCPDCATATESTGWGTIKALYR